MTSRERVKRAINHQLPDRVPIDLGATRASGIAARVYDQLKARLGVKTPTRIFDSMQLLAEVELEVLDRLHVDVVPLEGALAGWCDTPVTAGVQSPHFPVHHYFAPGTRIERQSDGAKVLKDPAGTAFARMPADGFYFDFIKPTMSLGSIDPDAYQPSATVSDEELSAVARRAQFLHDHTDKAVLGWGASISMFGLSALMSTNITLGHLDEWLCMLMVEKQAATDMMTRCADAAIARLKLYQQAVGDKVMVWGVASDDAGTQRAGLVNPQLFDEMIKPHYRRLCDWVHQHTPYKTFLHSCGAVAEYLDAWIGAGVDIVNPVQISAEGMSPQRLMRDFGGRVVFWGGGSDTQKILPLGSPEQVRAHVRDNINAFTANLTRGGFVFTQVHNIQPNVPVENVEAMLAAARKYGKYPI